MNVVLTLCSTFLLWSFADAANGGSFDVIIIGAGWAGMAAADHLIRQAPNVSVAVLESSNRTGGRTHAIEFGRADGPGRYILETGSNWICGLDRAGQPPCSTEDGECPQVTTNKIYDIAQRLGIRMSPREISEESQLIGLYSRVPMVYDALGRNGDPTGAIRDKFLSALRCFSRKVKLSESSFNRTVRSLLTDCGWNPQTDVEWAVEISATECSGVENDSEMAEGLIFDRTDYWWGHESMLVVDQHPRGYARVLDEMVKDTIPTSDPRVIFDAHVVQISNYRESQCEQIARDKGEVAPVVVKTRDDRVFYAKEIISTLPLGVLQKHHTNLFVPPLPTNFTKALSSGALMMRNVTRVALQFPAIWWDNSLPRWVSTNKGANDIASADLFSRWRNMNHADAIPGSHIIVNFMGDPMSTLYEALPDDEVKAAVMKQLQLQHPNIKVPDPTDFYISRHGYDERRYGAFPVERSGSGEFCAEFWKPVTGCDGETRIRFAGEAMCYTLSGYTHGGLYSGISAAAQYLFDHNLGPDPYDFDELSLCDWYDEDETEDDSGHIKDEL